MAVMNLDFYPKFLMVLIIELAWGSGLRITEILSITIRDLNLEKQEIFIPHPKGNRAFTKGSNKKLTNMIKYFLTIQLELI